MLGMFHLRSKCLASFEGPSDPLILLDDRAVKSRLRTRRSSFVMKNLSANRVSASFSGMRFESCNSSNVLCI